MQDLDEARGQPHTCDDAEGGDTIAAACGHVGATVAPSRFEGTWIAAPYIEGNYDEENPVRIEGGASMCRRPGPGITPDMSKLGSPIMSFG